MTRDREVHAFLSGKLQMQHHRDGPHPKYYLPARLGKLLPATLPVQLQHGRGEVAPRILRQIADLFGVKLKELEDAVGCHYGAGVLYTNLVGEALIKLAHRVAVDPIVYEALLCKYCDDIPKFLAEVRSLCGRPKLKTWEAALLKRGAAVIGGLEVRGVRSPQTIAKLDLARDRLAAFHAELQSA